MSPEGVAYVGVVYYNIKIKFRVVTYKPVTLIAV